MLLCAKTYLQQRKKKDRLYGVYMVIVKHSLMRGNKNKIWNKKNTRVEL